MGKSNAFMVPFSGLKLGIHNFEFAVDNSFFEKLEYSPITEGEVEVNLALEKKSSMMVLNFELSGWVGETCDRCTVDYQQQLKGENKIYVKFGDDYDEPDDNLIVIPREAYELDVTQLIYEFIGLSIPIRKVPCEENDDTTICDKETLKVLEDSESEQDSNNPLWVELNKIKDQLKK